MVVEHNKIVDVVSVGAPHVPIDPKRRPAKAEHEIDGTGMYLMPGFIDNHVHYGDPMKAPEAEYCNKLWLANGITTVRGVPAGPLDWALHERERSAKNETVAPRIFVYQFQLTGDGWKPNPVLTPELGREWVRFLASKKADGIKILGGDPNVIAAILDEGKKYKMGCHWSPVVSVSSRMSCFNYKSPLRAYVTGNTRSTFKPALFAFAL